jgi:hypothetical protein
MCVVMQSGAMIKWKIPPLSVCFIIRRLPKTCRQYRPTIRCHHHHHPTDHHPDPHQRHHPPIHHRHLRTLLFAGFDVLLHLHLRDQTCFGCIQVQRRLTHTRVWAYDRVFVQVIKTLAGCWAKRLSLRTRFTPHSSLGIVVPFEIFWSCRRFAPTAIRRSAHVKGFDLRTSGNQLHRYDFNS